MDEPQAELIHNLFDRDFATDKLEEAVTDYVLRCSKGVYKGFYIYLNVTAQGELIGSSSDKDITLTVDDAELAPKHASIKLEMDEENNRVCYVLRDCKSGSATWVKIRHDIPVVVKNNMEIKIGKKIYVLRHTDLEVNEVQEWLLHYDISYLKEIFEKSKIITLTDLRNLTNGDIDKIFKTFELGQERLNSFLVIHSYMNLDFPQLYVNKKLELVDINTSKQELLVGWAGATISSKTYVYQKPPEKLIKKQDFDDYEENPCFELIIRYMYGQYILQTWRNDNFLLFFRVEDYHTIIPDDTIKLGNLELTVQRFNTGVWLDQGKRQTMEDMVSIVQDLGVSSRTPVSCFGVFDGHHGDECVKYMSQNLFDNLREQMLKAVPSFDQNENFYSYMANQLKRTFKFTDEEFYQEYQEDKAIFSGCVCAVSMVIGDYIVTANLGDCRAILCREGQAIALSTDHKPNLPEEKARIEKKGGTVTGYRLETLAVSRAFGDFSLKKQKSKSGKNLLSVKPDIRVHHIDFKKDEFIVLCSDGVIEGFQTNQNLITFIRDRYSGLKLMDQDPQQISKEVLQYTYQTVLKNRNQTDNLSLIIVNLSRGVPQVLDKSIII